MPEILYCYNSLNVKVSLLWANSDPEEHITKIHEAIFNTI